MPRAVWCMALLLATSPLSAAELSGRFSMFASSAYAQQGDIGYDGQNRVLSADQQSLRLMLDQVGDDNAWALHLKNRRQHVDGWFAPPLPASDLFRYRPAQDDLLENCTGDTCTRVVYELDRAQYQQRWQHANLTLGRQAIDWGSGRLWQPLNVFGAFAPTDLDTDFKPGIDALLLDWYPDEFSTLSIAYVLSDQTQSALEDSGVLHYRQPLWQQSELLLQAGSIIGNRMAGAALEGSWGGMGWRAEASYYQLQPQRETVLFAIAGIDYQFSDGTLMVLEGYHNSRGAATLSSLNTLQSDTLVLAGLQPQLAENLLGMALSRDLSPLWRGGYILLLSSVNDEVSPLQQLSLSYSVSNESDLLLALMHGAGKGRSDSGQLRSEFGYLPSNVSVRLRFYF